ncbi:MAG: N-acetylmuramoyl-L-alanine amidase, partial [Traorella sp.]
MAIKIYIDQGHNPGLINAGASANGLIEADVNYQAGVYLKQLLDTDCNFEVRLSRNSKDEVLGTDTRSSLQERVNQANDWPADYFISLHCNSSHDINLSGSEVYVYASNSPAYDLGDDILNSMCEVAKTRNNGIH